MTTAIVSFKQLGDIIMLEPLSRLLAERSGAPAHLFTKRDFAPIVGLMEGARALMWSPQRYEELLALHEGTKATRRAASLNARGKRLIVSNPKSLRWEHRLVYGTLRVSPAGARYMARYFHEEAGGRPENFTPPRLAPPPAAWRPEGLGLPARYVVVHPTAAWQRKFWTPENWARLIGFVQAESGLTVVISAGRTEAERRHCEAILALCERRPLIAAGQTSIPEFAWLIANAAGLVAIDGSSCHFADAFGVPVVKLFGQTSERSWHYHRPGAWLVLSGPEPLYQRPLATGIPLDPVIAAARSMLEAARQRTAA